MNDHTYVFYPNVLLFKVICGSSVVSKILVECLRPKWIKIITVWLIKSVDDFDINLGFYLDLKILHSLIVKGSSPKAAGNFPESWKIVENGHRCISYNLFFMTT